MAKQLPLAFGGGKKKKKRKGGGKRTITVTGYPRAFDPKKLPRRTKKGRFKSGK